MKPLTHNSKTAKNTARDEKAERSVRANETKPQAQCCAKLSKSVAGCHD